MYKSNALDPLDGSNLTTETLSNGCLMVRTQSGDIVRTQDALGTVRDFSKEPFTCRLMMRTLGSWTKLENGYLDAAGTLFYRRGDVEIQERLNGVHIHTNRKTGVQIETDHINHIETMRQSSGEVWRRETKEKSEIFEIWYKGNLSFRSEAFTRPEWVRLEAAIACGKQALSYVAHHEQSFHDGQIVREKYTFRNPNEDSRTIAVLVNTPEGLLPLRNIVAMTTVFQDARAIDTTFESNAGKFVRIDPRGAVTEFVDKTAGQPTAAPVAPAMVLPISSHNPSV